MERFSKSGRDYFTGPFLSEADALVDWKHKHLTPFRSFLSSPQKGIYDEISGFLMDKSGELPKEVRQQLFDGLQDPDFLSKQQLPVLKQVYEKLKSDHTAELISRREDYLSLLEQKTHDISAMTGLEQLDENQQRQISQFFAQEKQDAAQQSSILVLNSQRTNFEEVKYPDQLTNVNKWIAERMAQLTEELSGGPFVQREYIHINKVHFAKQSGVLENEADVNDYVESLRQALIEQIKNNKVINL